MKRYSVVIGHVALSLTKEDLIQAVKRIFKILKSIKKERKND